MKIYTVTFGYKSWSGKASSASQAITEAANALGVNLELPVIMTVKWGF
jgi:hypothetical protein